MFRRAKDCAAIACRMIHIVLGSMTAYRTVKGISRAHVSPEDQLMLLLARGTLPSHVQEQALALLATPLRWDVILERAMAHEVYPLLYRSAASAGLVFLVSLRRSAQPSKRCIRSTHFGMPIWLKSWPRCCSCWQTQIFPQSP